MKTHSNQWFFWLPRILCIAAILFISMFALDSFAPGRTIWQQFGVFFMHLIPSFVLLAVLLIAWKWELIGGLTFILLGLGLSPFIFLLNHNRNGSIGNSLLVVALINLPFVLVGILFLISHFGRRKV
jgi:hypothetical protein